jgi:hypothetical protein
MLDLVLTPEQEHRLIPRRCDAPPRRIVDRAETAV